jgi:hypothetical protein
MIDKELATVWVRGRAGEAPCTAPRSGRADRSSAFSHFVMVGIVWSLLLGSGLHIMETSLFYWFCDLFQAWALPQRRLPIVVAALYGGPVLFLFSCPRDGFVAVFNAAMEALLYVFNSATEHSMQILSMLL